MSKRYYIGENPLTKGPMGIQPFTPQFFKKAQAANPLLAPYPGSVDQAAPAPVFCVLGVNITPKFSPKFSQNYPTLLDKFIDQADFA